MLRMAGLHNVKNALAAAAASLAVGATLAQVVQGLEAFEPVKGRSRLQRLQRGGRVVTLVDDSYNANPDSVRAAIDVLSMLDGPRWLLLGDMGEVGDQGPAFHAEVGAFAAERGIEQLWTAGTMSAEAAAAFGASAGGAVGRDAGGVFGANAGGAFGTGARHFASVEALLAALGEAPQAASLLVKGSRFMRMERVVQALAGQAQGRAEASGGGAGPAGEGARDAA